MINSIKISKQLSVKRGIKISDIQYNLQFEKLCDALRLGEIVGEPKAVSGGLLHRMYVVETKEGKYAVKALNPKIMVRPPAMQQFINSKRIVEVAVRFNGAFIHEIEKWLKNDID